MMEVHRGPSPQLERGRPGIQSCAVQFSVQITVLSALTCWLSSVSSEGACWSSEDFF